MKNILSKIKVDYSTYLLVILALFAGYIKNIFIIMVIVLIHELGHVFFFRMFNIDIDCITIYPFGGVTYISKKIHERIYKDVLISIGGIIFQVFLILIVIFLYKNNLIVLSTYKLFILYNKSIIFFNLIPIIPLDGSKLVLCIFSKFISYYKSYLIMIVVGIVSLLLFIFYNFLYKVNDLILYIYLIYKLCEAIKLHKQVMNKFYLERLLYDNYYNGIISGDYKCEDMRIDKYYFFKKNNRFINEKDYIKSYKYKGNFDKINFF